MKNLKITITTYSRPPLIIELYSLSDLNTNNNRGSKAGYFISEHKLDWVINLILKTLYNDKKLQTKYKKPNIIKDIIIIYMLQGPYK